MVTGPSMVDTHRHLTANILRRTVARHERVVFLSRATARSSTQLARLHEVVRRLLTTHRTAAGVWHDLPSVASRRSRILKIFGTDANVVRNAVNVTAVPLTVVQKVPSSGSFTKATLVPRSQTSSAQRIATSGAAGSTAAVPVADMRLLAGRSSRQPSSEAAPTTTPLQRTMPIPAGGGRPDLGSRVTRTIARVLVDPPLAKSAFLSSTVRRHLVRSSEDVYQTQRGIGTIGAPPRERTSVQRGIAPTSPLMDVAHGRTADLPTRRNITHLAPNVDTIQDGTTQEQSTGRNVESPADLYLDGAILGRWIVKYLEQQVVRPNAGVSTVDPRLTPTWTGSSIGI